MLFVKNAEQKFGLTKNYFEVNQTRSEIMLIMMIDDFGRIRIPKELRRKLKIHEGDYFQIEVNDEKIILTKMPDYKKGEGNECRTY